MSGIKYLLDTNFIIGLLKQHPDVQAMVVSQAIQSTQCAYCSVTRMELLGFHGIAADEIALIERKLACMTYLALNRHIEDEAIRLKQWRKIKLPDAIIAATALTNHIALLTLDQHLHDVMLAALGQAAANQP